MSTVNHALITAREEKGWTQKYVAQALGVSEVTISRWEHHTQWPRSHYEAKLCRLFDRSMEELGFVTPLAVYHAKKQEVQDSNVSTGQTMYMDMKRRQLFSLAAQMAGAAYLPLPDGDIDWEAVNAAVARPAYLDERIICDVRQVTTLHWHMFQKTPSKALVLDGVLGHMHMLLDLLQNARQARLRRQLYAIASELWQMAGEIFFDLNDYQTAISCYLSATSFAHNASDNDLLACALTRSAYPLIYMHNERSAVLVLDGAEQAAKKGNGLLVSRYWVAAVQAEAYAGIGDVASYECCFAQAASIQHASGKGNGTWLRYDATRLNELQGACLVNLKQPKQAIGVLEKALPYLSEGSRRRGMVFTDLALASIQKGDLERAQTYTRQVGRIANQGSGMLQRNIQILQDLLEGPSSQPVRKLKGQLRLSDWEGEA